MQIQTSSRSWDTRRTEKKRRLARAAAFSDGRVVPTADIVPFLESLIAGDRVVMAWLDERYPAIEAQARAQVQRFTGATRPHCSIQDVRWRSYAPAGKTPAPVCTSAGPDYIPETPIRT